MKGKVLVIEDDKNWQKDLRLFLERAGFHVEVADNLEDALRKVEKELFHFITIDMQLDERNNKAAQFEGWNILDTIKRLRVHARTPTMIITGFTDKYLALKKEKQSEGIFHMPKRGLDPDIFIRTVEDAVKRFDLRFINDYRGD